MSFGAKTPKSTTPIYTGIQLQTSTAAAPFIILWGRNRSSTNILQYTDFKKHKQKQQGGKGGPKNKTYTYSATVILGLCEGPIVGIGTVWKDGDTQDTLADLGLTLFTGTYPQAPWGYMVTKHPTQAFNYKGVAYVAAANYDLGSSAAVPNHSFEIKGLRDSTGYTASHDADCANVLHDFLFDENYGLLVPMSAVDTDQMLSTANATTTGDDSYQTYCRAMGFGMSPVLSTQEAASSIVQRWCQLTNTAPVWTGYTLKFVPYCYQSITGNGVTFVPNIAPVYTLTDDDYVSNKDDPLSFSRVDPSQAKNAIRFVIKDPNNQYNDLPVPWQDQNLIDDFGLLQDSDFTAAELTDVTMAATVTALYGKRGAYIRNTYTCVLGPAHCLLEAMDIVEAYDPKMGVIKLQVTATKEQDDGTISVTLQPFSVAVSSVMPNDVTPMQGYQINNGLPAGFVNPPLILEPPANLTNGVAQVWAAISGGDGTTENVVWGGCTVYISADGGTDYQAVGTQDTPARMGKLTAALPAFTGSNPDAAHTLSVDLAMSGGDLQSVSAGDASSNTTLSYMNGEYLSFETATLTTPNGYDITNLWRNLYGTAGASHAIGDLFARLDENIFEFNLPKEYIGVPLKFKFQSYNVWGGGVQDLSDCVVYDYSPLGTGYAIGAPGSCVLTFAAITQADGTSLITGTTTVGASAGPFLDHYDVQYTSDGGTTWHDGTPISADALTATFGPALATTNYQSRARAVSSAVGGIPSAWVTSAVVNSGALVSTAPDPCTGLAATGGNLANALSWTAPTTGAHFDGFKIYAIHGATGSFGSAVLVGQSTIPAFTHTNLAASDTWRYWVVAYNLAGNSTEDGPQNATTTTAGGGGGGGSWMIGPVAGTGVAGQTITDALLSGYNEEQVLVIVNGQIWTPVSEYTISGTSLDLLAGTNNPSGDVIVIRPLR